jgi:hypothetical protein
MSCLLQVLPILLIVLVTFFSSHSEPVYSLARDAKYVHQLHTGRLGVPYWVKNQGEFDKAYPIGNYKRLEVERQVSVLTEGSGCALKWEGVLCALCDAEVESY